MEASKRAALQELLQQLAETRTQKKEELIRSVVAYLFHVYSCYSGTLMIGLTTLNYS